MSDPLPANQQLDLDAAVIELCNVCFNLGVGWRRPPSYDKPAIERQAKYAARRDELLAHIRAELRRKA